MKTETKFKSEKFDTIVTLANWLSQAEVDPAISDAMYNADCRRLREALDDLNMQDRAELYATGRVSARWF